MYPFRINATNFDSCKKILKTDRKKILQKMLKDVINLFILNSFKETIN